MIYSIIIGLVAGYIASKLQKGSSSGILVNLILGVLGGVVGGWLFSLLGIATNSWIGDIICGTIGAVIVIWVVGKLRK